MKRILATAAVLLASATFVFVTLGSKSVNTGATYKVELDNAFGLVSGADFKVAGVVAGKITNIDVCGSVKNSGCQSPLDALITVSVNEKGFGAFHSDAFCQSRPQSLIGEYFLDCQPGTTGPTIKPGSTIQVTHTQSTIPADLVQNIMRLPYRERFTLIINELGAAVAARSQDLQTALQRADPALAQTDDLLSLLASDARTIRDLNANANTVVTALAQNNRQVQRFIVEANNTAAESASSNANSSCAGNTEANCIAATWNKLPGFLEQLRPAMQKLGAAADAQDPVFANLNAASSNLETFFHELVPFSHESVPSLQSLGQASVVGKPAVKAALPTVKALSQFTGGTTCLSHDLALNRAAATKGYTTTCLPELSQNLAMTLDALDTRKPINYGNGLVGDGPVEQDARSPDGGIGYTGLEGLLEYVFNITNAINSYSSFGHELAVDLFANKTCSPYADPQSIANNIASYVQQGGNLNSFNSQNPRTCYAFLGPNQPGVTEPDPTNPGACVPDPGGYPVQGYNTHYYGVKTNACKLQANPTASAGDRSNAASSTSTSQTSSGAGGGGGSSGSSGSSGSRGSGGSGATNNLSSTVNQIVSQLGSAASSETGSASTASSGTAGTGAGGAQTQQLLNYLLAP